MNTLDTSSKSSDFLNWTAPNPKPSFASETKKLILATNEIMKRNSLHKLATLTEEMKKNHEQSRESLLQEFSNYR